MAKGERLSNVWAMVDYKIDSLDKCERKKFVPPRNAKLKAFSRDLRKNMTDAENGLWSKLRGRQLKGFQFYRQRIIGNYIVDFYSPTAKLVIEIDGGQHYSSEMVERDKKRDDFLRSYLLKVMRFTDTDVLKNIEGVVEVILANTGAQE